MFRCIHFSVLLSLSLSATIWTSEGDFLSWRPLWCATGWIDCAMLWHWCAQATWRRLSVRANKAPTLVLRHSQPLVCMAMASTWKPWEGMIWSSWHELLCPSAHQHQTSPEGEEFVPPPYLRRPRLQIWLSWSAYAQGFRLIILWWPRERRRWSQTRDPPTHTHTHTWLEFQIIQAPWSAPEKAHPMGGRAWTLKESLGGKKKTHKKWSTDKQCYGKPPCISPIVDKQPRVWRIKLVSCRIIASSLADGQNSHLFCLPKDCFMTSVSGGRLSCFSSISFPLIIHIYIDKYVHIEN